MKTDSCSRADDASAGAAAGAAARCSYRRRQKMAASQSRPLYGKRPSKKPVRCASKAREILSNSVGCGAINNLLWFDFLDEPGHETDRVSFFLTKNPKQAGVSMKNNHHHCVLYLRGGLGTVSHPICPRRRPVRQGGGQRTTPPKASLFPLRRADIPNPSLFWRHAPAHLLLYGRRRVRRAADPA